MLRTYEYFSDLKPFIEGFVEQKRANGYSYEFEAYIYTKFDGYCFAHNLSAEDITKAALKEWMTIRDTESKGYFSQRISFVRQLLIYINSLGKSTYIPRNFTDKEKNVPHIFSDEEIKDFFNQVNIYVPRTCTPTCAVAATRPAFLRMSGEYKVLFRLIYCCGLRNSEACNLTWENVNLDKNAITIIHSKGDKDRLVYLHDDMAQLLGDYRIALYNDVGFQCRWVFPGVNPENKFLKTTVDRKFNEFWCKTKSAGLCDKKPTVHSLRHKFVIKRMNLWMDQGINLNVMMLFLSKFLGHKGRGETFYYYHQVDEAFKIIRQKDSKATTIIPEVTDDE